MLQSEKTILLVEDDTSTRLIINRGIANWGCKVLSVSSGEEALRVSSMITPDLALIDISLPGIDGVTLAKMLIQKKITAIILMTADKNYTINTELQDYKVICKPFKINDLREIVTKTSFVFDQG
jgi:DNA-binding response OmpR family regulator